MTTRLVHITARAVPDHKLVEVHINQARLVSLRVTMSPRDARRLAGRLNEAADAAEVSRDRRGRR